MNKFLNINIIEYKSTSAMTQMIWSPVIFHSESNINDDWHQTMDWRDKWLEENDEELPKNYIFICTLKWNVHSANWLHWALMVDGSICNQPTNPAWSSLGSDQCEESRKQSLASPKKVINSHLLTHFLFAVIDKIIQL